MSDNIQFLKELQFELKTQETDSQAAPRFWTIMDYKWIITEEGYHDRVSVCFPNSEESIVLEDFVKDILLGESHMNFTEEQVEELREIAEWDDSEILEWTKQNCGTDSYLVYEKEEPFIVQNTMFLTKAEAKRHLELNRHHYTAKAHTYAMTVWRAPKAERLLKILERFDWDSVCKGEEEVQP